MHPPPVQRRVQIGGVRGVSAADAGVSGVFIGLAQAVAQGRAHKLREVAPVLLGVFRARAFGVIVLFFFGRHLKAVVLE